MATPNNVHADGLVAAVASASADEYLVDGLSAEVAWQDRSLGTRASPLAFVLFQDPALSGKDAITDATSQYGPFISNAMPLISTVPLGLGKPRFTGCCIMRHLIG